ncbi:MAG: hypothetical protein WAK69_12990 [Rhodoplanes sp.]
MKRRSEARERGNRRQEEDRESSFVLQPRLQAHLMHAGLGHQVNPQREIKAGTHVPADEQRGGGTPVGQQHEGSDYRDADRDADEQAWAELCDPRQTRFDPVPPSC